MAEPVSYAIVSQLLVVVGALLKTSMQNNKRLQEIREHLLVMQLALQMQSVKTESRLNEMAVAIQTYRAEVLATFERLECRFEKHVLDAVEKLRKDMKEERKYEQEHLFHCMSQFMHANLQKIWYAIIALGTLMLVDVVERAFATLK
jgi:hypothetical protein